MGASLSDSTAFVYALEDAEAFIAERPNANRVVALAPSVRAALEAEGIAVISSDQIYSDRAHARVVVRQQRAWQTLSRMAEQDSLDSAASEVLMILAGRVSSSSAAMWELLRAVPGPWCIYEKKKGWLCIADWKDAHAALMRLLLPTRPRNSFIYPATRFPRLAKLVFHAATSVAFSRDVVVLHEVRRGLNRLVELIESKQEADVLTIGFGPKTWRLIVTNTIKLAMGQRRGIQLLPPLRSDLAVRESVSKLLRAYVQDAVVVSGFSVFEHLITESCAQAAALAADLSPALKRLGTRSILVWDSGSAKTVAYAHAGQRAGATVFIASHATAGMFDRPIGRAASRIRGITVTGGGAVNAAIVQSPTVAAVARQVAPRMPQIKAEPFLWGAPPARTPTPADEPALLLWAGNFIRWQKHRPWIDETPDETLAGLVRVAEAVIAAPSVRLEVRIKRNWRSKGDIDAAALDRFVPKHERIIITADGSFADSLGRATAVIAHSSTAIEEALRARVPVLLWGARGRAHFLSSARNSPPVANSRAAVYAPSWDDDLSRFLTAIAIAHRDQPLTDVELTGLVWHENVADLSALAQALAHPKIAKENAYS